MSTVLSTRGTDCTDSPNVAVLMEGLFACFVKGAKRLASLSPKEADTLKRLFVAFAEAPTDDRKEIMEAIIEIALPDEMVGGVSERTEPPKDIRESAESWRLKIGDAISNRRRSVGMTQMELATKAGIPQSHVSRLERGMHAPTHITIKRIAKALKIAPGKLDPGYPE